MNEELASTGTNFDLFSQHSSWLKVQGTQRLMRENFNFF